MSRSNRGTRVRAGLTVVIVFISFGLVGALFPGIFDDLTWVGVLALSGLSGLVMFIVETRQKSNPNEPSRES